MKYKYKSVDIRTVGGLRRAEALQRAGWQVVTSASNLDRVMMERGRFMTIQEKADDLARVTNKKLMI